MPDMNSLIYIKDNRIESELVRDGFTTASLIDRQEIDDLLSLYEKYFSDVQKKDKYNLDSNADCSAEIKMKISEGIQKVFKPHVDAIFGNYEFLPAIFFIKKPGIQSPVTMHQDPTLLVDEAEKMHIKIWCPLLDVDENNGALQMVKGSHVFVPPVSGVTLPPYFSKAEDVLYENMTCMRLKAGEAVIFDNRTLHCSMPNLTSKTRITAIVSIVAPGRQFISLYRDPKKKHAPIEVYLQEHDWFMNPLWSNNMDRPKIGIRTGILDYRPFFLNKQEMTELVRHPHPYKVYKYRIVPEKKSIISRLRQLFS